MTFEEEAGQKTAQGIWWLIEHTPRGLRVGCGGWLPSLVPFLRLCSPASCLSSTVSGISCVPAALGVAGKEELLPL